MTVRRIDTISDLHELDLKPSTMKALEKTDIDVKELVLKARNDAILQNYWVNRSYKPEAEQLSICPGVGKVRAVEIIAAVNRAGFILHESSQSRNARRLVAAVFNSPRIFIDNYEILENMSTEALTAVDRAIEEALSRQEALFIKAYYGLAVYGTQTYAKGGDGQRPSNSHLRNKALAKLRRPDYLAKLEIATCYSHQALIKKVTSLRLKIKELQQGVAVLIDNNPYSGSKIDQNGSLEELDLTARTRNLLKRHNIFTVKSLLRYTDEELLSLRGFGDQALREIHEVQARLVFKI